MTIQITIIKIEGYGKWTLKLGSDREAQLQILQSDIYNKIQGMFSERDCIVYSNRFDELIAITNGLSIQNHKNIMDKLSEIYDELEFSMSIGIGTTPLEANIDAYNARKDNKIAYKNIFISSPGLISKEMNKPQTGMLVQIIHLDVDNSTKVSEILSPYEITAVIFKTYSKLIDEFIKRKSMTFYLGGDNFMIVSNNITTEEIKNIKDEIYSSIKIKLNCGVGWALTGREAVQSATKALDTIRQLRKQGIKESVYEIKCTK